MLETAFLRLGNSARTGLGYAALTSFIWGAEPLVFQQILTKHSPEFITWVRFVGALPLFFLLAYRFGAIREIRKFPILSLVSGGLLGANYFCFMQGLKLTDPTSATIMLQSGALFLALFGALFFKEKLTSRTQLGLLIAILGYSCYFATQSQFRSGIGIGEGIVVIAALSWALFACCQRELSKCYDSLTTTTLSFFVAGCLLTPLVDFAELRLVTLQSGSLLAVAILATFLAYFAFGEALKRTELAQVSALLALNPVITLGLVFLRDHLGGEPALTIHPLAYFGATLAIVGIMLVVSQRAQHNTQHPPKKELPTETAR